MNHKHLLWVIATTFAIGLTACHDDPLQETQTESEPDSLLELQDSTIYSITYRIDRYTDTTIVGYAQLVNLIDGFCDIAMSGNGVIFWNSDLDFFGPDPLNRKESITTSNRDSLIGWCTQMFINNSASLMWYENYPNHELKAHSVSLPIFPTQDDLSEYITGCWVFTKTYISYWDEMYPFIQYQQNGTYQFNDTLIFNDTTVYSSTLSIVRPYEIIGSTELLFPFPSGDCGDTSKIIQIGHDTLLIMNCAIKGEINYLNEDRCTYRYMFARTNSK